MRILTALTYYRPHYSGLTIYADRLVRALAARGHQVTVLTSRYDRNLPAEEISDGVCIIRPWVMARVSKGVLMPGMISVAWKLARQADIVHLHLPQLDAAPIALLSRLLGKPVVLSYQCDLRLPPGPVHWLANKVSNLANHVSARLANVIVVLNRDYAENSSFLRNYLDKVQVVIPPVELPEIHKTDLEAFQRKANIQPGQRLIGMVARLASEKGVEYLIQAMEIVLQKYPTARVLYAGQHQNVMGEEAYAQRLAPMIARLGDHWTFLGGVSAIELRALYHTCEVTVLPSINSTEAFGLVQVESMICGTPVVASDIPGVRQPVKMTGMGYIVPPMNGSALAQGILQVLDRPDQFNCDVNAIARQFAPSATAQEYEQIYQALAPSAHRLSASQRDL
jgi:glycosyltransferase involved in cell wall biosynthesis